MRITSKHLVIFFVFLFYFLLRVYFSTQSDFFEDDNSYLNLRQIQHISDNHKPLTYDQLSYGGRTYVSLPFYNFIMNLFYHDNIRNLKIVNNFFAATIILAIYMVCFKLTRNQIVSTISALVTGFNPIYLKSTLNNLGEISILFPGTFFLIYFMISMDTYEQNLKYIIPISIFLVLISPSSFFILFGLLIFHILKLIEKLKYHKIEIELLGFLILFYLWLNFIIFKPALKFHGFSSIYGNVPVTIFNEFFVNINLIDAFIGIGFLPLIFGMYTIYKYLFKSKSRQVYLIISFFIGALLIFIARVMRAEISLMFLGASLSILMAVNLKDLFIGLKLTKISKYAPVVQWSIIFLIFFTQVIPGTMAFTESNRNTYSQEYIDTFKWLRNTPNSSVILSIPEDGNLITYFGNRINVADTEYLLILDADTRLSDIRSFYTHKFKIEAIRILEKYKVDYVIFSNRTKIRYNIESISFIDDPCFELVYNSSFDVSVWRTSACEIRRI